MASIGLPKWSFRKEIVYLHSKNNYRQNFTTRWLRGLLSFQVFENRNQFSNTCNLSLQKVCLLLDNHLWAYCPQTTGCDNEEGNLTWMSTISVRQRSGFDNPRGSPTDRPNLLNLQNSCTVRGSQSKQKIISNLQDLMSPDMLQYFFENKTVNKTALRLIQRIILAFSDIHYNYT